MEVKYLYTYDYIPPVVLEEEDNYNDERKLRIEESIDNVLLPFEEQMSQQQVSYTKNANKGEGLLTFTNLSTDMEIYKEIDRVLGELGLGPTNTEQLTDKDPNRKETPETHTMVQDKTAESTSITEEPVI